MIEPIKIAFGRFMERYYLDLSPTTKPMIEFVGRGLSKSIQWCPSRMVDSAEDMLAAWQQNDTDTAPTQPPKLPVILVAMARDYVPTARDFTRQIADKEHVMLPDDDKERHFKLRMIAGDVRAQLAIFASDEPTAKSLAGQFLLFLDATGNRRFYARFDNPTAQPEEWPVIIETPDTPFISVHSESKNLCILAVDITLKANIPLYSAPGINDENNDQSGIPNTDDPSGYLGVDSPYITPGETP
jgi:hypothetical protein